MHSLPVRRIATSALCATFLLGIAGPVAVAADHGSAHATRATTAQAPVPDAEALLAQTKGLGDIAGVLKPVTDLLEDVLKADNGQLPAADATKFSDAVREAVAKANAAASASPQTPPSTTPTEPKAPNTPNSPSTPNTPNSPNSPNTPVDPPAVLPADPDAAAFPVPQTDGRVTAPDLRADALKALQSSVDSLVKAATGGDAATVKTASTTVVTDLVNVVAAISVGGGLPAANLQGLPKQPTDAAQSSASDRLPS
jgi:hypothetical protein